jgi:hypothetical protein
MNALVKGEYGQLLNYFHASLHPGLAVAKLSLPLQPQLVENRLKVKASR